MIKVRFTLADWQFKEVHYIVSQMPSVTISPLDSPEVKMYKHLMREVFLLFEKRRFDPKERRIILSLAQAVALYKFLIYSQDASDGVRITIGLLDKMI